MTKYLQENFRVIKLLHSSDKTKLWIVENLDSEEKFLLKVIARTNLLYSQIAGIKNAALPKIYYVEESGETTYIVEEFLCGLDLQKYLETRGALDEQSIFRLAIAICDALKELHKWHIIHRDIKPSNLFLTDAGDFKLIDFDAARMEKPGRFSDTRFIGTPGFAAPEQYGFHQTDERTDIYSLGLTLKLLLGYEDYHGYLLPVLEKCVEFDPNKRFNTVENLKRAIIRRYQVHKWKKFAISACVSVVCLGGYFFQPMFEVPVPVEIPVAEEKIQPTESNSQAIQTTVEKITVEKPIEPEKNFVAEENFPPISLDEPVYYEEPTPQPTIEPAPTEEIVPKNSVREIDYSAADSTELATVNRMSRQDFANQMRNLNLSEEELDTEMENYYKRVEVNNRTRDFEKTLPEDMPKEEKFAARAEFVRRAKNAVGLQ